MDYFDFYLMHAQNSGNYGHFKACRAYETAFELKKEGKVRHVGISFHDTAEVLEQILTDYPEVEVVQLQLNYVDFEDPAVQSRRCYEVCRKHGKPVIVMEPVKGGTLVSLPDEAKAVFDALHGGSYASYAIRFAAGFPGILMVLSGMSDLAQMEDNLSFMRDFRPLNGEELAAVMNAKQTHKDWNADFYYHSVYTAPGHLAADCIKCGKCEKVCPQHLPIQELLEKVSAQFGKKEEA